MNRKAKVKKRESISQDLILEVVPTGRLISIIDQEKYWIYNTILKKYLYLLVPTYFLVFISS